MGADLDLSLAAVNTGSETLPMSIGIDFIHGPPIFDAHSWR